MKASTKRMLALLVATLTIATAVFAYATELSVTVASTPIAISKSSITSQVKNPDNLDGIVINVLPDPAAGTLKLGKRSILRGEGVAAENLHKLNFESGSKKGNPVFSFIPVYKDGKTGEPVLYEITEAKANATPIAGDLSLTTYRNIVIGSPFNGTDPDDDILTYKITGEPRLGTVKFDTTDGLSFLYEPYQNKSGTDSFTYIASDDNGVSEPATVTVKIEKQKEIFNYADMSGDRSHYAAIRLAEEGILMGRKVGDSYYLEPDELISRGEFIAMAVALSELPEQPSTIRTSFADDEQIPTWVKPFAAAAVKAGYVQGDDTGEARVLRAKDLITRAEATVILNNCGQLTDVATMRYYADEDEIPVWAKQAAVNLETTGIIQTFNDGSLGLTCAMTRADSINMLYNMLKHQEQALVKTGLFSWIK